MAGGNDINNELTLDVSNFTSGLAQVDKKLDSLDAKLAKLDNQSGKLEKDLRDLGTNAKQASDKLGAVTQNLDGLAGGLDRTHKSIEKASNGSSRFKQKLSELSEQAKGSDAAMSSLADWNKFYGKSLDDLRPKMQEITKSHKQLSSVTESSTKAEVRAIQSGIQDRIRALSEERKINDERIKVRKNMTSQLEQLERRAETRAAFARADAYKTRADGTEVRRYVGKNSGRHSELMAEISAYKQEADQIRQQKAHIDAIVGEMRFRNSELNKAIQGEQALLNANKQTLQVQKEQREETERLKEAKKKAAAQEKELTKQASADAKVQAKVRADAEKQAQRDVLQAQRQAHKEIMQMRRDELQMHKEMAAFATGAAAAGATGAGVKKAAEYQDVMDRLRAYNYTNEENAQIMERTDRLTANNKFLSKTEALQGSIDAISALAHNDPKFIDNTLESVMRDAFILKAKGYDKAELSDIVKNLYAAVEKRGLATADYSNEAVKTSDLMRRMVVASGGKVTVADMETVMNNIGSGVMTISDEGWLKLLPLIEQNKTSGGGNGGGGGVARVGTLIKMLQLLGSGRKLTNIAAQRLVGAGALNDIYEDGAAHDFKQGEKHNKVMSRALMTAGFKNQGQIASDPVGAMQAIRGGIMDFMMREANFKEYFGKDARKHSYDKKGQMIDADGKVVDKRQQANIENAAMLRFLAPTGMSNNNVTGMMTLMNQSYAERANHSVATAKNSKGQEELLKDLSDNWNQTIIELKAQAANLAVAFEPLLRTLTEIPKALTEILKGLAGFATANPTIASLALGFLGFKVAVAATTGVVGLFAKTLLSTDKGAKVAQGMLATLQAAFLGTSSKAKSTGDAVGDMAGKAAQASKAAGDAIDSNVTSGANRAAAGVKVGVGSIFRVLGTLLNWAGWLTLAAMFGWAIGKWIGDIQVGGITINQHMQNLFNDIFTGWDNLILNMRSAWQDFLGVFGAQNEQVRREIAETRGQISQQNADLRNRTDGDAKNALAKRFGGDLEKIANSGKNGKFTIDGVTYHITPEMARENSERLKKYDGNGVMPFTLPKSGRLGTESGNALSQMNNSILAALDSETVATEKARNKPAPKPTPKVEAEHTADMKEFNPTPGAGLPGNGLPPGMNAANKKPDRKEFIPQNAYDVSLANLKGESAKDVARLAELQGIPKDYNWLARQAFAKEWMQGKLDDGRDPSARPFANRAWSKDKKWTENDINWNDQKVKDWVALSEKNQLNDGIQKALEYAAGKIGEASSNFENAVEEWNNDTNTPSDTAKAQRDFAKFEAKNSTATQNPAYQKFKGEALARIAGTNFAEMGKDLRDKNKELHEQFLENDVQATREAEKRRYETETKKVLAVKDSLDAQIAATKAMYGEDSSLYKDLVNVKKGIESEFTTYLENQNKLRVENTRSAYDQTMATWRDLESNVSGTLSSYGERAATDLWDVITGDKKLDLGEYFGSMSKDIGSNLFKSAWGNASKMLMGEGENTNVIDMVRNFATGKQQSNDGWIGRYINSKTSGEDGGVVSKIFGAAQGFLGKFFGGESGTDVANLTGDQATNANTSAIQQLTMAFQQWAIDRGFKNTPVALPSDQAPAGTDIIPMEDRVAVDPNEATAAGTGGYFSDMFTSIKNGFTNLFSSSGGLMSKIGNNFGSIFSGIGTVLSSAFGGKGSTGGRLVGAAGAAMQGYATGGYVGAAVNGISALFSANGNAFDGSGHMHKFANGGAFTNGLYNSPTLFKFANGGGFSQGVMGEAGPEAVMPLQRDSSGRLGVAVNGSTGGAAAGNTGGTVVSINIEVNNNGSTSTESESGNTNSDWKAMSDRVKSVVQEEIVKQKRPGGMLH